MRTLVLVILFSVSTQCLFPQRVETGGEIGLTSYFYPSATFHINGFQLSCLANFYPKHAIFFINSGISYQNLEYWNFIKVPLGLGFCFGKIVKVLIGGGIAGTYIIIRSVYLEKYYADSKSDISLNCFFFGGLDINFIKNLNIFIKTQFESGITPIYTSFGGHGRSEDHTMPSISLNIGVYYLIFSKNN